MERDPLFAPTGPGADARSIVSAFVDDPTAEDRYNEGVLDRLVGALFASPRAAPAECSLHPNPSHVCYERFEFDQPWRAVRCSRSPRDSASAVTADTTMLDSRPTFGSDVFEASRQKVSDNNGAETDAPQATLASAVDPRARGESGWTSFCETTCRSMGHPNFRLLWRYGSSRKGTLLEKIDEDAPLVVADDTFIMAVHRACIDALPDAVADATFAATLFAAAHKIGERLDQMHGVEPCTAAPCADARRWSTSRLASESDALLAFCDALCVWHNCHSSQFWSDVDDCEARALSRVAWASGAASAQEAVDLLLAHEEAECRESARLLLAPRLGGRFVVVSCGEQIFTRRGGHYPDGDTEAILKRHRIDSHWTQTWVDEADVKQTLVQVIRAGGSALAEASVGFGDAQGGGAWVVIRAGQIVSSPLARAAYNALYAWSIGPSLLMTEAALCAIETVLAQRPEYVKGIPDQVAALAVTRRAMNALYADPRVRTTVIHRAIVDRADALWTRRDST